MSSVITLGMPSLIVALAVWYFLFAGERTIPVGVVMPNFVAAPMSRSQAEAFLSRVKETATIETRSGDVTVRFPGKNWPERRDGQLALAQQFARADETVEGRKRTIAFHDPDGNLYAKADAKGVVLVR